MIVWTLLHEKLICLMILADHWSNKSADLTVFARIKLNISELWTCVKVMKWLERCGKFAQNNAYGAGDVCFPASVELFVI